ncbi:MAG: hypothetical protein ACREP9_20935 [Candidatus Dormibacteraceae bacterium]
MRPNLVRVVHRQGWEVELPESAAPQRFASREAAMAAATAGAPEWIEVGEIQPAGELAPQHHRWQTLRRSEDGSYRDSGLGWGGGNR